MMLEVFAKEGLIGKVQFIGYFLNAQFRGLQKCFCFQNNQVIYPFSGSLATDIFHYSRKMFCCKKHFIGIMRNATLLFIRLGNVTKKALEQIFFTTFRNTFLNIITLIYIKYLIK